MSLLMANISQLPVMIHIQEYGIWLIINYKKLYNKIHKYSGDFIFINLIKVQM